MKNLIGFLLFSIIVAASAFGSDKPEYAASLIPDELKKDADYVIRYEKNEFRISSIGKATYTVHVVYTLFNKRALHKSIISLPYDKLSKIKYIKGTSYDQFGKRFKVLKSNEIFDESYVTGGTFISDGRVKHASMTVPTYPFTIEYEYEEELNGLATYPNWQPQGSLKESVQYSEYIIISPESIPIRYKELFLDSEFSESYDKGLKTYKWQVKNMPAINEEEYFYNGYSKYNAKLLVAPVEFEYAGYKGKLDTWENFGKWQYQLNLGRDKLPELTVAHLKKITEGMSDHEKVATLYKYLQSKTRYVSVKLGIGGWQPAEAAFVDKVGYGDCKGLSNYMLAMLKAVGITSYYTKVYAGINAPDIITDFVDIQSNHIILCVPVQQDTIWLECTSQNKPFGFLGRFTANRHALVITEDGGKLVKTQTFCNELNYRSRYSEMNIDVSGNAFASVESNYGGYQSDDFSYWQVKSHEKKKEWYYERIPLSGLEIKDFSFEVKDNPQGEVSEKLQLVVPRYASISGKRITFTPNLISKTNVNLPNNEKRMSDIEMRYPYVNTDTIMIYLPESYVPEFIPEEKHFKHEFGEYFVKVIPNDRNIMYIRQMKIFGGTYPKEKYKELQEFFREVQKSDNSRIVLINKT